MAVQRTGLEFCATNNFRGTFANSCFIIFTQERINMYVDQCLYNFQLQDVFQCFCQCTLQLLRTLKAPDIK